MKQIITLLLLVGLAYLGFVQVVVFVRKQYLKIRTFYNDLKEITQKRNSKNEVFELKIRKRVGDAPTTPPPAQAQTVTTPLPQPTEIPPAEEPQNDELPPPDMSEEEYEEQTILIVVDEQSREYITGNGVDSE